MVFIRTKYIKCLPYSYLVSSVWNKETKRSEQNVIKYLGSTFTKNDIPLEYRKQPSVKKYFEDYDTTKLTHHLNKKPMKQIIQKIYYCKECNRETSSKKILICTWCNRKKKLQLELGMIKIG